MDSHVPRIINEKAELVAVDTIFQHPRNVRRGNLETIKDSILYHGFYGSLIVNTADRFILAGNHRYQAAVELGLTELPVTWITLDESDALKVLLVDNKSNDDAGYDTEALTALLVELDQTQQGLDGTGYDTFELQELLSTLQPPPSGLSTREPTIVTCPHCEKEFQL